MKKLLAIFLISLFVFQVSNCQENGEELVEEVEEEVEAEAEMESEIEEQAPDQEWTALDVDLAESNTTLAFYYSLGAQWVISETIGNHEISNSTWVVTVLHDLSKKIDDEQYKYNVSFQDIGNLDDTFQAEYVIGKDRFSTTGIRSWTTYILGDYTDNDGNTVRRVMKSSHQYENDTVINQFLDSETLEPISDPAAITSWNNIPYNQWKDDATINDVGKKAAESAIQKALDTEILSAGDWKVNYFTPATLPEYGGDVYYRFTFALYDASGFLIANGNAYAIKDSEGNFENLTSGIGSISVSA